MSRSCSRRRLDAPVGGSRRERRGARARARQAARRAPPNGAAKTAAQPPVRDLRPSTAPSSTRRGHHAPGRGSPSRIASAAATRKRTSSRPSRVRNCRLAAQSRAPRGAAPVRRCRCVSPRGPKRRSARSKRPGSRTPRRVASALSHGEQRQLEIAMVLRRSRRAAARRPARGMGAEEAALMVELLRRLAPRHAILLVEHDMERCSRADADHRDGQREVSESGPRADRAGGRAGGHLGTDPREAA